LKKSRIVVMMLLTIAIVTVSGCSVKGHENLQATSFWQFHSIIFLAFITFFPRLTILFATPFPVGFFGCLGWFFMPRIYAAIIATTLYWDTNPVLCIISWIVALIATGASNGAGAAKISSKK
jgi:hypothetical protein